MDLDDIKNAESDSDLIPGIYNYCDRWCERCYLSSRCFTYKMEMREPRSEESQDLRNKEFWDELSDVFALTWELLYEIAEEEGIDLDALDDEDTDYLKLDDPEIENHPVTKASEAYFESSRKWLDSYHEVFKEKAQEYSDLVKMNINPEENTNNTLILSDLFEIINWYHTMIFVKAKRAVMSSFDTWEEDDIQNDANGTAKVVLKCIERSSFAWNGILKHMPEQEDVALRNLANLTFLKKSIEEYFPDAEKFIRPGFDENI